MNLQSLEALVTDLGLLPAPRYTLEQVATILGLTMTQVRELLKKRRLKGLKGSLNRWMGVLHADLESYFLRINSRRAS